MRNFSFEKRITYTPLTLCMIEQDIVWVPGIYTSPTLYLVGHLNELNSFLALGIFALETISILVNYWADRQRQKVQATSGECKVWGAKPVLTVAKYTTLTGEEKQNLLLCSGW